MRKAYLFLAEGFEETEAVVTIDVLRRGGVDLESVSVSGKLQVEGAHGITVTADILLGELAADRVECLIFPGGMPGAKNLSECESLIELLQHHYDRGKLIAAICAAPALVLGKLKTENRLRLTCYPGFEKYVPHAEIYPDGIVVDNKLITAKGPAFAARFGLKILEQLVSGDVSHQVASGMLL